ncbi:MFS transporter [Variovorax sp. LARHSF232]
MVSQTIAPTFGMDLVPSLSQRRKAAAASVIGTTIEVYDFFIFGTAAALIFSKQFFPSLDPTAALIASFLSYAAGYFARPLGAFLFGYFGDRWGRKDTLLVTLVLMATPTILIGLLPTYAQIGLLAPLLLCVLRILQGIAYGGEWGGAVLLAVEYAPRGRKALWGSLPAAGASAGIVLASLAWAATSSLQEDAFQSWGWRLPFLASALLLVVGVFLRRSVKETPQFETAKRNGETSKAPISELFATAKLPMLRCMGMRIFENSWFAILLVFVVSYAVSTAKIPKGEVLNAIAVGAAISMPMFLFVGWVGDRVGQKIVYAVGAVLLAGWTWIMFDAVSASRPLMPIVVALGFIWPLVFAPQTSLFAAQFDTRVRYSGLSVSTQIAGILGGGIAPFIAAVLAAKAGGSPHLIAVYLTALAGLGLLSVYFMRPTKSLDD